MLDASPAARAAIEALLERCDEVTRARAAALLARVAWEDGRQAQDSLLAPGGWPIEANFASRGVPCRLTFEVAAPGAAPLRKWRVLQTLAGGAAVPDSTLLRALRAAPGQRWGLWLGVHGARTKVYQEVTPAARDVALATLRGGWNGSEGIEGMDGVDGLVPTMLGVDDHSALELYGEFPRAGPASLHRVFAGAGLGAQLPLVLDALGFLSGHARAALFDALPVGLSRQDGALTLYVSASRLCRSDAALRRKLLALTSAVAPLPAYAFAGTDDDALAQRGPEHAPLHGIVGLTAGVAGLDISVGVRPHAPGAACWRDAKDGTRSRCRPASQS